MSADHLLPSHLISYISGSIGVVPQFERDPLIPGSQTFLDWETIKEVFNNRVSFSHDYFSLFLFSVPCYSLPWMELPSTTNYFAFIAQLTLIVIICWQDLRKQPVERVTWGYIWWEYRASVAVSKTHHVTYITIFKFPISQSEAVSTVPISRDIKSLI